jgi:ribosomal protein S18 acetylase RimI-like enzyme/catechol 2,3-dioxygenase-like lactoylglutathione lyase family enzyme
MAEDPISVRDATAADAPQVIALLRRQLDEHDIRLAPAALAHAVRGLLEHPAHGRILVAADGGTLVGVAVLSFTWTLEHGGKAVWLDELYVDERRRRLGIGRRLVETAIARARAAGCLAMDLEVEAGHDDAQRLYERLGFRRHRRTRFVLPLVPATASVAAGDHRPFASIDHLSLGVNDLARSKAFYDAALAPLGLVAHEQIPGEVGYGPPGESPAEGFAVYIGFEDPKAKRPVAPSAGFHLALRAPSRAAVRAFHAAALALGGRDFGAPGPRPHYGPHYYGAFVLDPDGHHVEAVCHAPGDD